MTRRRLIGQALTSDEFGVTGAGPDAPLWFNVLREAGVQCAGHHLGEVGGTLVGETLLAIAVADPCCFVNVTPTWKPVLPGPVDGLGDIIRWVLLGETDGRRLVPAPETSPGWRG